MTPKTFGKLLCDQPLGEVVPIDVLLPVQTIAAVGLVAGLHRCQTDSFSSGRIGCGNTVIGV